jgi:hypothetical protein
MKDEQAIGSSVGGSFGIPINDDIHIFCRLHQTGRVNFGSEGAASSQWIGAD